MNRKPYLSCPVCGKKQMSLLTRAIRVREFGCRFKCMNCGADFRIPKWCSPVQAASFIPSAALGYQIAEWLGIQSAGIHMALMFLLVMGVNTALGVLFAYKVPLEVMDTRW